MRRFFKVFLVLGLILSLASINALATQKLGANKKQENFRLKIIGQITEVISQENFSPKSFSFWRNWTMSDYFGEWWWYAYGGQEVWLGTFSRLDYQPGDTVPLQQMRRMNSDTIKQHLGFETEVRLWKNFWLGGVYLQQPTFTINTTEEQISLRFEDFQKISEGPYYSYYYYEYYMKLGRPVVVQQTNEKFSSTNTQIYAKFETGPDLFDALKIFWGVGLDIWQLKRKLEQDQTTYFYRPWDGTKIANDATEYKTKTDENYYIRPFVMAGLELRLVKGLGLGAEVKAFKNKNFLYPRNFLLPNPQIEPPNHWKLMLSNGSLYLYLSCAF